MSTFTMSPELLSVIAGAILSLLFSYFPRLNTKYAALDDGVKKLIMLGILLIVIISLFVLACVQFISIDGFVCNRQNAFTFAWMFIYAVLGNLGTFKLSPQTSAVKEAANKG